MPTVHTVGSFFWLGLGLKPRRGVVPSQTVRSASKALDIGLTVSEKGWGEEPGDTSRKGG